MSCASVVLFALTVCAACGESVPPPITSTADAPTASVRRPDGIVIDKPHALPVALDRAEADGIVSLREPLPKDAVAVVVRAYVDGFLKENAGELAGLLAPDAVWITPPTSQPNTSIYDVWQGRLRSFDYSRMAGVEVMRADKIELLTFDEMKGKRPPSMQAEDVLARVPIQSPRLGADVFFPDVVVFLLRRDKAHYVIAALEEDYSP